MTIVGGIKTAESKTKPLVSNNYVISGPVLYTALLFGGSGTVFGCYQAAKTAIESSVAAKATEEIQNLLTNSVELLAEAAHRHRQVFQYDRTWRALGQASHHRRSASAAAWDRFGLFEVVVLLL